MGCVAVDKHRNRNSHASIIQLDLTRANILGTTLQDSKCSPGDSTGLVKNFLPKPLRAVLEPDGISSLEGINAVRVSQGNILYSFCGETFNKCHRLHKLAMCENLRSSLFWCTSFWSEMECAPDLFIQDHQACAYGSTRPKLTRLVANFEEVHLINLVCLGNHRHEPRGTVRKGSNRVFASLEVHYPQGLCTAIVNAYLTKLGSMGFVQTDSIPPNPAAQSLSGKQPLSGKMLLMVPEYKSKLLIFRDAQKLLVWPKPCQSLDHCKILHSFQVGGFDGVENVSANAKNICTAAGIDGGCIPQHLPPTSITLQVYGVPWKPFEFIEKASVFDTR